MPSRRVEGATFQIRREGCVGKGQGTRIYPTSAFQNYQRCGQGHFDHPGDRDGKPSALHPSSLLTADSGRAQATLAGVTIVEAMECDKAERNHVFQDVRYVFERVPRM